MSYRLHNISRPLQKTCDWLLDHPKFSKWLHRKDVDQYHGVIWIKGNPGTGKSTLMKQVFETISLRKEHSQALTIGHFFNNRGVDVERNLVGLFRSLLHQLCQQSPALLAQLTSRFTERETHGKSWQWQLQELKDFFQSAVLLSQSHPITVFIDALDECEESDARSVVSFLGDLSSSAVSAMAVLNICLSSRHYPNIQIPNCLEICVEEENGDDILRYIETKFKTTLAPEVVSRLQAKIIKKASGVFLWVVLVIQMLNKAADDGDRSQLMDEIIERVPQDLNNLFVQLLQTINPEEWLETEQIIRWILLAERPLTPTELRYALAFGNESYQSYSSLAVSPIFIQDDEKLERLLRTRTRGLVEVKYVPSDKGSGSSYGSSQQVIGEDERDTKDIQDPASEIKSIARTGRKGAVQFIHQSVRDFLLRNLETHSLPAFRTSAAPGEGHHLIAKACINCVGTNELRTIPDLIAAHYDIGARPSKTNEALKWAQKMCDDYPFMNYAITNLFTHSKKAELSGWDQTHLAGYFHWPTDECFKSWICLYDLMNFEDRGVIDGPSTSLTHVVAENGIITCLTVLLEIGVDPKVVGGRFYNALEAASAAGHSEAVKLLLEHGAADSLSDEEKAMPDEAIYLAAYGGHRDVVQLLLGYASNIDMQFNTGRTALQEACLSGDQGLVKILLENGANQTIKDDNGSTALHEASWYGGLEVLRLLLEKGAALDVQDDTGFTALHWAAWRGHKSIVETLLINGANFESKDKDGQTPLHLAAIGDHEEISKLLLAKGAETTFQDSKGRTALHWAAFVGSSPNITLLIQGRDIFTTADFEGQTVLHHAARGSNYDVIHFLIEHGCDVECYDHNGRTPLHIAAWEGRQSIVNMLLDAGATLDQQDNDGRTALHWAAWAGRKTAVEFLLRRGANIQIRNCHGDTVFLAAVRENADPAEEAAASVLLKCVPNDWIRSSDGIVALHRAILHRSRLVPLLLGMGIDVAAKDEQGTDALYFAVKSRDPELVRRLLVEYGASVQERYYDKTTILHQAASIGDVAIFQLLLEYGAQMEAIDENGSSALHEAAIAGHVLIVSLLLENGADVDRKADDDETPLHFASWENNIDVVEALLRKGANVSSRSRVGTTALHIAAYKGYEDLTNTLLSSNADVGVTDDWRRTALFSAVDGGHEIIVRMLLQFQIEVDQKDHSGWTALQWAAWHGYEVIVKLLVLARADVKSLNRSGWTCLHNAAGGGHLDIAIFLLEYGADIGARDNDGRTALHWAAEGGFPAMCRLLLDHCADPTVKDSDQKTVWDEALRNGNNAVLDVLLERLGELD